MAAVDLHWIPLGAGGNGFVRRNGLAYERLVAWREHRAPQPLFHAALTADLRGTHYVVEQAWPAPARDPATRGVQVTGPVWVRGADRLRALRYEVRCWEGGVISDLDWRIGPAVSVSSRAQDAKRVLAQAAQVPALTWGRRGSGDAEMWNSNSVIAWVLASAGLPVEDLRPPDRGRAPGWSVGIRRAHA